MMERIKLIRMTAGVCLPLLAAVFVFSGCEKKQNLTRQDVESFYRMTALPDRNPEECDRFFRKNIRPVIKTQFPQALEKAYQYTGKTAYSLQELRGVTRCALFEKAFAVKTMDEAKEALLLLVPSLSDMKAEESNLFTRIQSAADPKAFSELAKALAGDLAELCLKDIDTLRTADEPVAEKRLMDLKFLVLSLPESESEVVGITRIVWDELDGDVNDIQLDKVRELLRGAYPALVL